jgi:hypothetical protein
MSYLLSKKSLTIVSVGSGMGVEEQLLVDQGYKVVCIDPARRNVDRYLSHKRSTRRPDYACVREYLANNEGYDGVELHYQKSACTA